MYKYGIFLLTCVIAIFYWFEDYYSPFYNALNIESKSSRSDVSKIFSMKGHEVLVEKETYIERGNASFVIIKIKNVSTECGIVDVLLSFFNDELVSIKYTGFLKKETDNTLCIDNILKKQGIYGSDFSKKILINEDRIHYDIIFSDDIIDRKIIRWSDKWS